MCTNSKIPGISQMQNSFSPALFGERCSRVLNSIILPRGDVEI